MKRLTTLTILLLTCFAVTDGVSAVTLGETLGTDRRLTSVEPEKLILKDPMIAGLMSATLPGLGQVYAGERARGLLFFIGKRLRCADRADDLPENPALVGGLYDQRGEFHRRHHEVRSSS